jgi:phosphoglycolate phosphatase
VRACIFDLDHTLVQSSLDLAAMALDIRAMVERARGPLAPRGDRYRVGELITLCQTEAPELEGHAWAIALDHEERALADAYLEPGALDAVEGARALGFLTVLWTNNARSCASHVLEQFALAPHFDLIVTRDDMKALKPDPDGYRLICQRFPALADAIVVGDSWVDGLAAQSVGVPFVAYRANRDELARRQVAPVAWIDALADVLPLLRARL